MARQADAVIMNTPATRQSALTGADWFLVALEGMMAKAGQGRHHGLTVLRLGTGFSEEMLRSAVDRLAAVSPIVNARLSKMPFGVPRWKWNNDKPVHFPIRVHQSGTPWEELGHQFLGETADHAISFEVIPESDGKTTVLLRWRHLFLDGKGVELLLSEIARLASDPDALPEKAESWGAAPLRVKGWRDQLSEAEKFKNYFYELAKLGIRSLGGKKPANSEARFYVEEFTLEESQRILERMAAGSQSLFQIGWFLAVAMRMHRDVFQERGETAESYQAGCAVQERKRGARHPIWQNHVSQLFFSLKPQELEELHGAASLIRQQFTDMSRQKLDTAFAVVSRFCRHLPSWFYLRMLRGNSGGNITSFFFSHTGEFMAESKTFSGAGIEQGWHIPTVSQPPGTGVFFGQRDGKITATISWRRGVINDKELALMRTRLRADLLES